MSNFYAQLNDDDICTTVSELKAPVNSANLIAISSLDESLLGKSWNGSVFSAVVVAAPTHMKVMDTNEFLWMFTGAELRAINTAADIDDDVYKLWQVVTNTNSGINLGNPDMATGLGALYAKGLLTAERYAEISLGRAI